MTVGDLKRELLRWDDEDKVMVRTAFRPYRTYKTQRVEMADYHKDKHTVRPRRVLVLVGEEESRNV